MVSTPGLLRATSIFSFSRCRRINFGLQKPRLLLVSYSNAILEDQILITEDVATRLENVPFKHFALRLPTDSTTEHVYTAYNRLLQLSRKALKEAAGDSMDYNVVMTNEWVAVIPRRTAGPNGPFGANAAGMLGMVSVPDQREREWWAELGYTKYLKQLGIPFEGAE